MTTPLAGRPRRPTAPVIPILNRQVRQRQRFGSSSGPYLLAALTAWTLMSAGYRSGANRTRRLRAAHRRHVTAGDGAVGSGRIIL
jgi:hypothetical protein